MTLANLIAYVVVFGLPIWLVAEEVAHRYAAARKAPELRQARSASPAATPSDVERRAPEGARAHASFV
jgi:hypothetical protein